MKLATLHKRPALMGLVVWFGVAWSWVFFTDMLDLAGSKLQGYILAVVVFGINVAITSSVMWKFFRLLQQIADKYGEQWVIPLGLPLLAVADFLACWLTTILWLGPQGSVDNVLPMGSPALLLANTPLRFAARLVGFYGLATFFWLTYFLLTHKKKWLSVVPLMVCAFLALCGWLFYRNPSGVSLPVTLISETLKDRVPPIEPIGSELVVFPEYGLEKITNKNLAERIRRTNQKQPKTFFVGSEQYYRPPIIGHINNLLFGNTQDGIVTKQPKHRLIPGGEDLAYIVRFGLRLTGQTKTLNYFSYAKSVLKGKDQLQPFYIREKVSVAAAVCSSIIAPQDYRTFARSGATVFTNSASLSIFKGSPLFAWQQKSLARFMAVANARYFLQSANAASAYSIDINGKQTAEVKGRNTLLVEAKTNTVKTPYVYSGEWLLYLGFGMVICIMVYEGLGTYGTKKDSQSKSTKKTKVVHKS